MRKLVNSPSESDRQAVAVLAAVTQSIQEQGQPESPTAYWAALMTALEAASADEPACTAILFLLSLITPRVPPAVLAKRFAPAAGVIISVLSAYTAVSVRLVRSALTCLTTMLTAQQPAVWADNYTFQVLQPLLEYALDSRPKVRHVAQDSLAALVAQLAPTRPNHPMVQACFKFCAKQLRTAARKDESTLLHLLNVLQSVVPHFGPEAAKATAESVLQLLNKGNTVVFVNAMQVLRAVLQTPAVETKKKKKEEERKKERSRERKDEKMPEMKTAADILLLLFICRQSCQGRCTPTFCMRCFNTSPTLPTFSSAAFGTLSWPKVLSAWLGKKKKKTKKKKKNEEEEKKKKKKNEEEEKKKKKKVKRKKKTTTTTKMRRGGGFCACVMPFYFHFWFLSLLHL